MKVMTSTGAIKYVVDAASLRFVGTSLLGGDSTGDNRGNNAVDIQSHRHAATEVAAGDQAVAVGLLAEAYGAAAVAIGYAPSAMADWSVAIGKDAVTYVEKTVNIAGMPIIQAAANQGNPASPDEWIMHFAGTHAVILSADLDLTHVDDYIVVLPSGCHIWLNEIGIVVTAAESVTVQPTMRFGVNGSLAKHRAAALTTLLTADHKRDWWAPLVPQDGETSISAGVTVAATAAALIGRFYWRGMLVEDE